MSNVIPFDFEKHNVRVIMIDGVPWFVAADVCEALGLSNTTQSLSRLDDDEQALISNEGIHRGSDQVNVINESGLYSLILTSRKQSAKRFKKWVTADVLPSIRKTGGYNADPMAALQDPHTLRRLLLERNDRVIALEEKVKVQEVSVAALDRIANSDGSITITETAKVLQLKPVGFTKRLALAKVIYRKPGQKNWLAYQHWCDRGYMTHKFTTIDNGDVDPKVYTQARFLPAGVVWLAKRLGVAVPRIGSAAEPQTELF